MAGTGRDFASLGWNSEFYGTVAETTKYPENKPELCIGIGFSKQKFNNNIKHLLWL